MKLTLYIFMLVWSRGYRTFFMLNSAEHEFFFLLINVKMPTIVLINVKMPTIVLIDVKMPTILLINVKMLTIVDILTFMGRRHFNIYEQEAF